MPSQWYCFTDDEAGPYTFQQLADLIARGELRPSDLVRREEVREWQRVDAVLGLLRAASQARQNAGKTVSPKTFGAIGSRLVAMRQGGFPRLAGERIVAGFCLLLVLVCVGELVWLWGNRLPRFPAPPTRGVVMQGPSRMQQMRPPSPSVPSIPGLRVGEPVLVPGFEHLAWLKSPALSADLLTIVYVAYAGPRKLDDLMIAERPSVTEPFQNHRPLRGVNSPQREAQPTLSPDGKELIFVQLSQPATLWWTQRRDSSSEFAAARALILKNETDSDQHQDAPQFLDQKTIRVTLGDQQFTDRSQWYAVREGAGAFKLTAPVPIQNLWPRYFLNQRGRRAYFPAEDGLQLTALSLRSGLFEEPEILFGTDVVGPDLTTNDDTIWVTPAEDVIFFCGPGRDGKDPKSRRLWMIRI